MGSVATHAFGAPICWWTTGGGRGPETLEWSLWYRPPHQFTRWGIRLGTWCAHDTIQKVIFALPCIGGTTITQENSPKLVKSSDFSRA